MTQVADVSQRRVYRVDVAWHEAGGRVVIVRRKFGRAGSALLRLFRVSPDLVLRLDALGSAAWRAMDGRRVEEVLEALRREDPEADDLPARLGRYLSTLASNGLIRLE